jgi:hypothetical protein
MGNANDVLMLEEAVWISICFGKRDGRLDERVYRYFGWLYHIKYAPCVYRDYNN